MLVPGMFAAGYLFDGIAAAVLVALLGGGAWLLGSAVAERLRGREQRQP